MCATLLTAPALPHPVVRRFRAPGVLLRSMFTLFTPDIHTIFTPCEVAEKSLVSDSTYDGRDGRPHPCLARRGRCRNRTPNLVSTPVLTSGEGRAAYAHRVS